MPRYIDADALIEGRVSNDPVVIAAMCAPTADVAPVVRGNTNADRIRGMSNSELAKFMYDTYSEGLVDIIRSQKQGSVQVHNREYYVDWLQQPAETEGKA